IEVARRNMVSETIDHVVHPVSSGLKRNLLAHLVRHEQESQVLVFVDTKFGCSRLAHFLERHDISADSIHGDKSQQARTETLENFKSGKIRVLVATDVAARGLDIEDLPSVINFELPHTAEDYVHRIGRTGRAGKKGKAVSLVSSEERHRLADIQKLIKLEIRQEIVPGYDPEPDFFDGEGGRRRRSGPSSRPAEAPLPAADRGERRSKRPERGDRPERTERAERHERSERGGRPGRQPSHIAPDGFDFSKPYEQKNVPPPAADGSAGEAAARPPQKGQRPIAFLLGGLGRKH
ncbi:MAG: ATP-dependent helicase, partial [Proteobacteria bacterium]|nr:ATP-dependent helicase [Pseudomonadota bacterium]